MGSYSDAWQKCVSIRRATVKLTVNSGDLEQGRVASISACQVAGRADRHPSDLRWPMFEHHAGTR